MSDDTKGTIPAGANRLPDLKGVKDVEAALRLWHSGASLDLVEAVGGEEARTRAEAEREAALADAVD